MSFFRRAKVCFLLAAGCTTFGSHASFAQAPPDLYHLMLDAHLQVEAADTKMISRMKECSKLLSRHYQRYKKLPESLSDFETIAARSQLNGAKNPYFESDLLGRELPATTSHLVQFEVVADYGLSKNGIDQSAKHPPKTWVGSPGCISIVQNSENLFALRAYGMDGKPVLDRTTGNAFYIFKDCSESD